MVQTQRLRVTTVGASGPLWFAAVLVDSLRITVLRDGADRQNLAESRARRLAETTRLTARVGATIRAFAVAASNASTAEQQLLADLHPQVLEVHHTALPRSSGQAGRADSDLAVDFARALSSNLARTLARANLRIPS